MRQHVRLALERHAAIAKIEVGAGGVEAVVARADDEEVAGVTYGGVKRSAGGSGQVR